MEGNCEVETTTNNNNSEDISDKNNTSDTSDGEGMDINIRGYYDRGIVVVNLG